MPTFISSQIPPPTNWQDFENLCLDLWKNIWQDPNTQKNGRQGQKQHGVDVCGRPNEGIEWAGVQCKGKGNYSIKQITEQEVKDEIEKAMLFNPRISKFIIASSGYRDGKIQELSRKITDNHLKKELFSVSIWSWEDIVIGLADYPDLIEKHYPGLGIDAHEIKKEISKIHEKIQELHSSIVVSDHGKDKEITDHKSLEADVSKFGIPCYGSSMISRKRILSLIKDNLRNYMGIYVCAPSGYGKSILLSQLKELKLTSMCWIDCENDNSNYKAFRRSVKNYIRAKYGRYIRDESPKELANSIEEVIKIKSKDILYFVIDHIDYIDAGIESFLREVMYQRSNVQIILAGTKFKFKKQKKMELNNFLKVIGYEDLAFDYEEVTQVFFDVKVLGASVIPYEFFEDILNITEG